VNIQGDGGLMLDWGLGIFLIGLAPGSVTPWELERFDSRLIEQNVAGSQSASFDQDRYQLQTSNDNSVYESVWVVRKNAPEVPHPLPPQVTLSRWKVYQNTFEDIFGPRTLVDQLELASLSSEEPSSHYRVHFEQRKSGVRIFRSHLKAIFSKSGELLSSSQTLVPLRRQQILAEGGLLSFPQILEQLPAGYSQTDLGHPRVQPNSNNLFIEFVSSQNSNFSSSMEFVYFPTSAGLLRGWHLKVSRSAVVPVYDEFVLDASDGRVLWRGHSILPLTPSNQERQQIGSWTELHYFQDQGPTLSAPGRSAPDGWQPPSWNERDTLIYAHDDEDPPTYPSPWFESGMRRTLGNSIQAMFDSVQNGFPTLGTIREARSSAPGTFLHPLDFNSDPFISVEATTVNAFTLANVFFTRAFAWGFGEAEGNFQDRNFSGEGQEGDRLKVFVQPDWFGQSNNAFFSGGAADGETAAIVLLPFNGPNPARDSGLDSQVVVHELAHGITIRLLGAFPESRESFGMLEGWSDFYALAALAKPGQDTSRPHPMGAYVGYQAEPGFVDNHYFGIRRYPYSISPQINPLTYADIDPTQFHVPQNVPKSSLFSDVLPDAVHRVGEVWGLFLWELTHNLVQVLGDEGFERVLKLVTHAVGHTPLNPSFVQGRDAILLANGLLLEEGVDACLIWKAAAKRGLGVGATSYGGLHSPRVTESFILPHFCD
jgi:hypothetical protein